MAKVTLNRSIDENKAIQKQLKEQRKEQAKFKGKDKSLIIVHTGDGKGKTTAAFGMVMRMVGHGWPAAIVQFMKSSEFKYAEVKLAEKLENLDVFTLGAGFTWDTQNIEVDKQTARNAWEKAKELMDSGKYRLVLLDEINYVLDYNFLEEKLVLDYLKNKPPQLHIVLTGRNASPALIECAQLVTEMKKIKHPYEDIALLAQKGIEW